MTCKDFERAAVPHADWLLGSVEASHEEWLLESLHASLEGYFADEADAAEAASMPVSAGEVHAWQQAADRCGDAFRKAQQQLRVITIPASQQSMLVRNALRLHAACVYSSMEKMRMHPAGRRAMPCAGGRG